MSNVCPTCNRKFAVVKQTVDKKMVQDMAKAQAAIAVLQRQYDQVSPSLRVACQMEAERLMRALSTPKLLWSIYRRRDKAAGYVIANVAAAKAQPARLPIAQMLAEAA